jgi:hypothetical protein
MNHDDFNLKSKIVLVLYNKKKSFFYLLFGFMERLWQEKLRKVLENIPRMSAEERGRSIGMLQTGCSIKKVRFWKCPMLLSMIWLWVVLISIHWKIL